MKLFFHSLSSSLVASVCLVSSARAATAPATPEKVSDGMVVRQGDTFLKVEVWGDNVLRVAAAKDPSFFTNSTPATQVRQKKKVDWKMSTSGNTTTLSTSDLQARIDLTSGAVSFLDAKGKTILAETRDGRQIQPAEVQGEKTFHVEQQW